MTEATSIGPGTPAAPPDLALVALESLPQPVFVFDPDHRLAFRNAAALASLDVTAAALPPGTPLAEAVRLAAYRGLYGPGDPAELARATLAVDRGRPQRRLLRRTDGASLLWTSAPLPAGGFIATLYDLTEQQLVAEEATQSSQRLAGVLDHLTEGVALYDADRRMLLNNPAYEGLIGLPRGTVRPGMLQGEVLRIVARRGEFANTDGDAVLADRDTMDRSRPTSYQRQRPNGQVLRFASQPMPEGGHLIEVTDITAVKRAEDAAQQRAALVRLMLDTMRHGIALFDAGHRLVAANRLAGELSGLPGLENESGPTLVDLVRRQFASGELGNPEQQEEICRAVAAADRTVPSRYTRVRPDGTIVEVISDPTPDGGFVVTFSDITARARAEAEAREQAATLRATLDNLQHGVMVFDRDRRLRTCNALTTALAGFPEGKLAPGVVFDDLIRFQVANGQITGPEGEALAARILAHDRRLPFEHLRTRPDGRMLEVRSHPTPDGGFIITHLDVTALARAEAVSRQRAATLQAALDAMRHGCIIYDPAQRLVAANSEAASCCDLPVEAMQPGRSMAELLGLMVERGGFGPGAEGAAKAAAMQALDRTQPYLEERRLRDGRIVEVRSEPTEDGGYICTFIDITRLAKAEAAARERAAQLQAMLDNMRHGVALFDAQSRVVAANQLANDLPGLPPGQVRPGRSLEALVDERIAMLSTGSAAADAAERARTLARDTRAPFHVRRTSPAGRTLDIYSDPLPSGGFVVSYIDNTDLITAQKEAQARAATLQTMQDTMRHGIALFGADQRLIIANALAAGLAGIPPEAMRPGMTAADIGRAQFEQGVFGTGAAAAKELRAVETRDRRQSHPIRRHMPDGRIVESASDPTPDGGFVITWTDVTALIVAESAAEARAAMLFGMLANMRHGVALFGPDRRLLAANRLIASLSGLADEQLAPGTPFDALAELQRRAGVSGDSALDRAYSELAQRQDRGKPHHYIRPARGGRSIEVASDPMPDGGFIITMSDITPLVAAEAAAASRAAMLGAALDNMRHGLLLFGRDRRLLAANPLAGEIASLLPEDLTPGTLIDDMFDRQMARGMFGEGAAAKEVIARLRATDRTRPGRARRTMPDGRIVESFTDPTPDGGFVVSFTDITGRAQAEEQARERAAMLRATLDNVRHGIAMYGPDRRLVFANRLAGAVHGLPEMESRAGAHFEDLVREQAELGYFGGPERAAQLIAEVTGMDRTKPIRYERRLPDGRVLDIASFPTPEGGFVVTHFDVTDLVSARAEASARAATLQVMLENTRHGISYFGPDQRLLAFNTLSTRLCGHSEGLMAAGMLLADLGSLQAEQGALGDPETAQGIMRMGLALDRSKPARYTRRMADGRLLDVTSTPTPDGGFVVTHTDVTELLEAQTAAADRATLLQVMLDSMRHGIALFDQSRRLVAANGLAAEFNGIPLPELRPGRSAMELGMISVAAGMLMLEDAQAAMGDDYSRPLRRIRRQPGGRVIEVFTDPTPNGGFVATYSDITALTRAETEARERAAILEVMLNNIRHGICYYGPDRRVVAANALAGRFGGHPEGAIRPGRSLDELIDEQLALRTVGGDAEAIATAGKRMDRSKPARYVRPTPDGRVLEVTSDPTPDGGFVVTSSDITALVEAEAEAQRRADIQQVMLDNIRHGIILFDATHRVVAANPMVRAMMDLPADVLFAGQSDDEYVAFLYRRGDYGGGEEGAQRFASVTSRDRRKAVSNLRLRPGGQMLEVVSDPTPDGGFVLTYTDVTEDRRVRAELERAKDAAEAASKAKSRFLATMSHELRTPLNAVIGFSEAFMVDRNPTRGLEYVRSIHEAGRHLLTLIDDILDVTRSETTGFAITESDVDVVAVAEGAVRVMQATAATAQVVVKAELPFPLPHARADEVRLRQVLLNLLTNAVKFTPAGGNVTLAARVEPMGDLVVTVSDTGIGIEAADMTKVFQPFTQLDSSLSRRFPGSGLGLYLSRALAEAQGAALTLESTPGVGTTAVLRIPKSRLLAATPA